MHDQLHTLKDFPQSNPLSAENGEFPYEIRDKLLGLGSRPTHRAIFTIKGNEVHVLTIRSAAQDIVTPEEQEQCDWARSALVERPAGNLTLRTAERRLSSGNDVEGASFLVAVDVEVAVEREDGLDFVGVCQVDEGRIGKVNLLVSVLVEKFRNGWHSVFRNVENLVEASVERAKQGLDEMWCGTKHVGGFYEHGPAGEQRWCEGLECFGAFVVT